MSLAVLLVDHGSRRPDAHEGLAAAGASLERVLRETEGSGRPIVEIAHMELSPPSIADGYRRCVERGASTIRVVPCFLSRGRHVTEDVPSQVAAVAQLYPDVQYQISPPLLELPGFIEMLARYLRAQPLSSTSGFR